MIFTRFAHARLPSLWGRAMLALVGCAAIVVRPHLQGFFPWQMQATLGASHHGLGQGLRWLAHQRHAMSRLSRDRANERHSFEINDLGPSCGPACDSSAAIS